MITRRGSILIVVLLLISFTLGIGISIFEKAAGSYQETINVQYDMQGAIYASTAIKAIKALFEFDNPDYDSPEDNWALIPTVPIQNGFVQVTITPADSRIPLNAMAGTEKNRERVHRALERVFSELGYEDEVWHGLNDWVTSQASAPMSSVKTAVFNREGASYTAKNAPLSSLYEIRLVPGVPHIYNELVKYVCMGEQTPKININFADNLTIKALIPEFEPYLDKITETRQSEPFKSKDALFTLTGSQTDYNTALPYFDVKSTLFYVRIEVSMGESARNYHVLLKRDGKRVSILRYIEGNNINYF